MDTLLQQLANGLVLGSSYVLVALGLLLVFGVLNIPNFAHGEMFMIGALVTANVAGRGASATDYIVGAALGLAAVVFIGFLVERIAFRPLENAPHIAFLISSLAVAFILQEIAVLVWGSKPVSVPAPLAGVVDIGGVRIGQYRLLIIAIVAVAVAVVSWIVYRTKIGREMRAVAQNREAALLVGVNLPRVTIATFAIGSVLAGLAGALLAGTQTLTPFIGFHPTLVAFAVLVIAGVGRIAGAVIGGLVVGIAEALTAGYFSASYRTSVVFIALVVFLVWKPGGAIAVQEKV